MKSIASFYLLSAFFLSMISFKAQADQAGYVACVNQCLAFQNPLGMPACIQRCQIVHGKYPIQFINLNTNELNRSSDSNRQILQLVEPAMVDSQEI